MAEDLSSLISKLSMYQPVGPNLRPKALGFVLDYSRFISTLNKINQMIGLAKVKQQVHAQIKSFIVNYRRHGKPVIGGKLHTLLYGDPGCGKTQLGKYLAELWVVSGCIPKPPPKPVTNPPNPTSTNSQPNRVNPVNSIKTIEQSIMRQNLNIRETQLKQAQEKIKTLEATAKETLTLFNNVRKRVQSKNTQQGDHIQAKFQTIKGKLRELAGNPSASSGGNPDPSKILPVVIPRQSRSKAVFGNHVPPSFALPSLPINAISRVSPPKTSLVPPNPPNPPPPSLSPSTPSETSELEVKFCVITRGDLIAKFQGHTTDKVRELFKEYDGGVIFVDEVYNLCTSEQDDFGKEILTEINNCMTAHPSIVFIFAGYRAETENVVMKVQPGLARRFHWTFEIEEYTASEISLIFQQQLGRDGWQVKEETASVGASDVSDRTKIDEFFKTHRTKFPHFGGDTERLCQFVTEISNGQFFEQAIDDKLSDEDYQALFQYISLQTIESAFEVYLKNSIAHQKDEAHQKFLKSTGLYM